MAQYIHPQFTPEILTTYQGYHLQIFSSGRAKVTLQGEGRSQVHYYAEAPKRDKEAYQRQKVRSHPLVPDHFTLVDHYLTSVEGVVVFRLHLRGNNNATADNAHLLATRYDTCAWLIFDSIVHEWDLPVQALGALLVGTGPKTGAPSVFHEFVPTYEHDWEDATFSLDQYKRGYRGSYQEGSEEAGSAVKASAVQGPSHLMMSGDRCGSVDVPQPSATTSPPPTLSPVTPREPQSAPARTQLHHEYPDGSLVDPYEEVPAPEAWALTRAEAVPLVSSTDAQPPQQDSEVWENPYDDMIFFVPDPDTGAREDDPYGGEDLSVRASDIDQNDPYNDPLFFASDPDPSELDEYLHHEGDFPQATMTKTIGTSTLYSSADLRRQVLG